MRAVIPMTGRLPINVKPEIIRLVTTCPPAAEYVCQMPFWSLHFFHAQMYIEIGDHRLTVQPGQALMTPLQVRTLSRVPGGNLFHYSHFHLPVDEQTEYVDAPVVLDMEEDGARLDAVFAEAARCCAVSRTKAEVALWYILQSLYGPQGNQPEAHLPGRLAAALTMIDAHLRDIGNIDDLARNVGVSSRHLNRLFVRQFGLSAAEFLREKRLMRARRLLESTDYLVKEIGAQVGLPDPHHFSNMIRDRFGCTPLQLREAGRPQ